ncbi:MAG: hypothetical protein ACHQII_00255 [Bacteroidia bacterium]
MEASATGDNNEHIKTKLLVAGIGVLVVGTAIYGGKALYDHYKKTDAEKQILTTPEVSQAMELRAAMNPSGFNWMQSFDGSDKVALFRVASEITDLNKVQEEYTTLYKSDLMDDIRSKIGADGVTKFKNTLSYNPNTVENKASTKAGKPPKIGFGKALIVTTAKANLRKKPQDTSKWSLHSNIIKLAEQGMFLGGSTGNTSYDNNGASKIGTLYIEIKSRAWDTRKPIFFWVAASQVKTITSAEMDATNPKLMQLNEKDTLNGIEFSQPVNTLIANYNAPIMDVNFKPVAMATPMQELGQELMQLDDNKGNVYIKFRSLKQNEYWVNKKFTQTI